MSVQSQYFFVGLNILIQSIFLSTFFEFDPRRYPLATEILIDYLLNICQMFIKYLRFCMVVKPGSELKFAVETI